MTYARIVQPDRKLVYNIPLEFAIEKRQIIVACLSKAGIETPVEKEQALTLHRVGQSKSQLGAIQWGGETNKIAETNCVSYIELRFYNQSISPVTEKRLSSIAKCRNDSDEALRFRFWKEDMDILEALCRKITEALRMTLRQFYAYFKEHTEKLAPKTLLAYNGFFTRIDAAIGHKQLDDITPNHIRAFIKNLSEPGVYKGTRKDQKQLSSTTIQKHHRLLNLLFNRAIKWGLCSANPCERTDTPKATSPHIAVYDEKTLSEFLAKLDTEETKYQSLILLALSTGMRRGELFALKWNAIEIDRNIIEIDRNIIEIRHTLQYIPGKGLTLKEPKTELSSRIVSAPPSVMAVLKRHKAEQAAKRLKLGGTIEKGGKWEGAGEQENDFVFCTWNGKAMHPDSLNDWLSKFTEANDLPHISPHAFRHMAASFLIKSGVDVRTVSGKLGHARTSTTTDIYAHVIQSAEQQTADIMADILADSKTKGKEILEKQKKQAHNSLLIFLYLVPQASHTVIPKANHKYHQ